MHGSSCIPYIVSLWNHSATMKKMIDTEMASNMLIPSIISSAADSSKADIQKLQSGVHTIISLLFSG